MTTKDNGNGWRERLRYEIQVYKSACISFTEGFYTDKDLHTLEGIFESNIEKEIQQAELRAKIEVLEECKIEAEFSSSGSIDWESYIDRIDDGIKELTQQLNK